MFKAILDYWNPENKFVEVEHGSGRTYYSTKSVIISQETITDETEIGLFEQYYKLNNKLRYCNGSYYKWQDAEWEKKYYEWIHSDDYKQKSFDLYYGNGVVD